MNIVECFLSLSRSLDFSNNGLMHHHNQTALIAAEIGKAAGLHNEDMLELFQASVIHDIGVISWQEKERLTQFDINSPWDHCKRGYRILQDNASLHNLAAIILSHHDRWNGNNPSGLRKSSIPLAGRIIHLADRVDILIDESYNILNQRDAILNKISISSGSDFDPDIFAIFQEVAVRDSFWFDVTSPWSQECLDILLPLHSLEVDIKYLMDVAGLFARVVDAKSPFTYRHSRGVAAAARLIGENMGLPEEDCSLLEIAGLLHDLGKLAIPNEVLEKPGRLTAQEYNIMKQHAYYTYWLLKPITRVYPLAEWAAYHHETPDGRGYPFGKTGDELDSKSRIITTADIFTALREERPYRKCMGWDQIAKIVSEMVKKRNLDKESVSIILDNKKRWDDQWAQL